jgi:FkbM family methyltransferase
MNMNINLWCHRAAGCSARFRKVDYICDTSVLVAFPSTKISNLPDLRFFHSQIKNIPQCRILDIGANKGYYAMLAMLIPDLYFYSFEPHPRVYQRFLLNNLRANQVESRGETFMYGFSNSSCRAQLWYDNTENGSLRKDEGKILEIEQTIARRPSAAPFLHYRHVEAEFQKLDDVIGGILQGREVQAIKVDINGAEAWMLDGGMGFFSATKAPMFIEIEAPCCYRFGVTMASVFQRLQAVGYKKFSRLRNNFWCEK